MINWKNIQTVFLDMDGTLLDLCYDNYIWEELLPLQYSKLHHMPLTESREHIIRLIRANSGKINAYCFDFWDDILGFNLMELHTQEEQKIQFRPNAKIFLEFLNTLACDVFILTNAHPKNIQLKLKKTKLQHFVKEIHSAHKHGHAKEELAFWSSISKEISFIPQRTLFIDDNPSCLRAAKRHGINNLFAIQKPCSKSARLEMNEFIAIEDFIDLIQPSNTPKDSG